MSKLIVTTRKLRKTPEKVTRNIKKNKQDETKYSEDLFDGMVMNLKYTISNSKSHPSSFIMFSL